VKKKIEKGTILFFMCVCNIFFFFRLPVLTFVLQEYLLKIELVIVSYYKPAKRIARLLAL
jgi:hypothetical protein